MGLGFNRRERVACEGVRWWDGEGWEGERKWSEDSSEIAVSVIQAVSFD